MQALVSIHDLMPETMGRVETVLDWLRERDVPPVTLLVVPGKDWSTEQIDRLRELATAGHPLAAHGWHHETEPKRLFHRIHAALISRNVAEHLALNSSEILDLLRRSRAWFAEKSLPSPSLYVPPAWALGSLSKGDLANAPFEEIEVTRGYLYPGQPPGRNFEKLPLVGFEADTPLREAFLKRWNSSQAKVAERSDRPLRISIHPFDLELRLRDQMDALIRSATGFVNHPRTH